MFIIGKITIIFLAYFNVRSILFVSHVRLLTAITIPRNTEQRNGTRNNGTRNTEQRFFEKSDPHGSRTHNLLIQRHMLYPEDQELLHKFKGHSIGTAPHAMIHYIPGPGTNSQGCLKEIRIPELYTSSTRDMV